MIYDAVLHEDLLTASLPASVTYNSGTGVWEPSEFTGGLLISINTDLTGVIGLDGETIPGTPETFIDMEYEFAPGDPGLYGFSVSSDSPDEEVEEGTFTVEGEGLPLPVTAVVSPLYLNFVKEGSDPVAPKPVEIGAVNGTAVLDPGSGVIESPHFGVHTPAEGRRISEEVPAEAFAVYYLHTDGRIDRNPYGAMRVIASGRPDGSWEVTE